MRRVEEMGVVDRVELKEIDRSVGALIEESVAEATAAPSRTAATS